MSLLLPKYGRFGRVGPTGRAGRNTIRSGHAAALPTNCRECRLLRKIRTRQTRTCRQMRFVTRGCRGGLEPRISALYPLKRCTNCVIENRASATRRVMWYPFGLKRIAHAYAGPHPASLSLNQPPSPPQSWRCRAASSDPEDRIPRNSRRWLGGRRLRCGCRRLKSEARASWATKSSDARTLRNGGALHSRIRR